MVRGLVRRSLALAMLFVVAVGGGGMPALDALVFHGPTRVMESFRSHYESSGSCHSDGCSIRSDVQPGVAGSLPPCAPAVVAVAQLQLAPIGESLSGSISSLRYLSRAPPVAA
jgi:hypothetical protein